MKKKSLSYPTEKVFAAACAALRINEGEYLKEDVLSYDNEDVITVKKMANKNLVRQLLKGNIIFGTITEADHEQGVMVRRYYQGFSFKILAGKRLSDFDHGAMTAATSEMVTNFLEVGIIAYLPVGYNRYKDRVSVEQRLATAQGYIAKIGDKVKSEIEVVKSYYNRDWNTSYITGLTDENKAVFFSYREDIEIGVRITVSGRVKDTRNDKYEVTQLTRVRVL
jgi:hypothetical protein